MYLLSGRRTPLLYKGIGWHFEVSSQTQVWKLASLSFLSVFTPCCGAPASSHVLTTPCPALVVGVVGGMPESERVQQEGAESDGVAMVRTWGAAVGDHQRLTHPAHSHG